MILIQALKAHVSKMDFQRFTLVNSVCISAVISEQCRNICTVGKMYWKLHSQKLEIVRIFVREMQYSQ